MRGRLGLMSKTNRGLGNCSPNLLPFRLWQADGCPRVLSLLGHCCAIFQPEDVHHQCHPVEGQQTERESHRGRGGDSRDDPRANTTHERNNRHHAMAFVEVAEAGDDRHHDSGDVASCRDGRLSLPAVP